MTPLRRQLEQAREAHLARHYPGDLAIDVLDHHGRPVLRRILWVGGFAATALAASIALMVLLQRPVSTTVNPHPDTIAGSIITFEIPPRPEMPQGSPLSPPPYVSLDNMPAKPEFPSRFDI